MGLAPTPTGGYRLVTSAGNVLSFGDATPGQGAFRPVAITPLGDGIDEYRVTGSSGSTIVPKRSGGAEMTGRPRALSVRSSRPPRTTARGWLATRDGEVASVGPAPYLGSAAAIALHSPVVGLASACLRGPSSFDPEGRDADDPRTL